MKRAEEMRYGYLAELIRCAMKKETPDPAPDGVSWQALYELAAAHDLSCLCYPAVARLAKKRREEESVPAGNAGGKASVPAGNAGGNKSVPDGEVLRAWAQDWNREISRAVRFGAECEAIEEALSRRGIACMPLKGAALAPDYPEIGMRSMVDHDLLYGFVVKRPDGGYAPAGKTEREREEKRREASRIVKEILCGRGYAPEKEAHQADYHEAYFKRPIYNFEMHGSLVSPKSPYAALFGTPWARAKEDPDRPGCFRLDPETEYLYLIAHEYKHFCEGEGKLRFLADLYVFLRKNQKRMDRELLRRGLSAAGLLEFEQSLRRLAGAIFGRRPMEREQRELYEALLLPGQNEPERMVRKARAQMQLLEEKGRNRALLRIRYLWGRVWLPREECLVRYPFFGRHRFLMPALILYRLAVGLSVKREAFSGEMKSFWAWRPGKGKTDECAGDEDEKYLL